MVPANESPFKEYHFCELSLLHIHNEALNYMEKRKAMKLCVVDFNTTFDIVNNKNLLQYCKTNME